MSLIDLTTKESRPLKLGLQVIYWSVLVVVTGLLISFNQEEPFSFYIKWALVAFSFKMAIFYSYFYILIPKWLYRSTWKFVLVTVLLFIIYPVAKIFIDQLLGLDSIQSVAMDFEGNGDQITPEATKYLQEWLRRALTVFLNIVMAFFIRFTVDWFKNVRIRQQMETQQLKSELAMLRNQVNPHFLFNTLNNIDAMVYKVSAEASEAIMKLSGIMRYMLYESNVDYVPLKKEMDYIDSYFELQRMRIKNKTALSFHSNIGNYQLKIAPMIFIPFVENAFKHADFNDLFISCHLTSSDHEVVFEMKNSVPSKSLQKDETGGIGLANVQRRLALIYPEKHHLEIAEEGSMYKVLLKISVHED
ncbi:MAG: sensor histidine kinase [Cyclobacteriaceae bacterium]